MLKFILMSLLCAGPSALAETSDLSGQYKVRGGYLEGLVIQRHGTGFVLATNFLLNTTGPERRNRPSLVAPMRMVEPNKYVVEGSVGLDYKDGYRVLPCDYPVRVFMEFVYPKDGPAELWVSDHSPTIPHNWDMRNGCPPLKPAPRVHSRPYLKQKNNTCVCQADGRRWNLNLYTFNPVRRADVFTKIVETLPSSKVCQVRLEQEEKRPGSPCN